MIPGITRIIYLTLIFIISVGNVGAHVELDSPVGGEVFKPGDLVEISWHTLIEHEQIDWDLYVSYDGGSSWEELETGIPVDKLSYEWTIPDMESDQVKIRILQDNEDMDYDDISGNFKISSSSGNNMMGGGTVTGLDDVENEIVTVKSYPNPFSSALTIELPEISNHHAALIIFDTMGKKVASFNNLEHFHHTSLKWQPTNLPSGIYYIKFIGENQVSTNRVMRK